MTAPPAFKPTQAPIEAIRARAAWLGFDALGIASASDPWPAGARLAQFVEAGRHGGMVWMEETLDRRVHPTAMWPEARSAVVVGLAVYLALSRSGPLGALGLLFTPNAMIVAQSVLAFPIVVALTHRVLEPLWQSYGDALKMDGASQGRAIATLLAAGRAGLVTVFLSAFGRVIAEVGAILIVGGNIRGVTRTMTTAIALETSAGDLPLALALGIVLIGICVMVSAIAFAMNRALTY